MTGVDLVIIAILASGIVFGFRQGFVVETANILGAVIALAVAKAEFGTVRGLLVQSAPSSPWVTVLSYLIVFLVVWGIIILAARRIRFFVRLLMLGMVDRIGGILIGVLQSAVVIETLIYLGERLRNPALTSAIKHAHLTPLFLNALPYLNRLFPHIP